MLDPFDAEHERLEPEDIAEGVVFMVTRSPRTSIAELWVMPTDQA
jgi:NADP-dependent 3-hydroxy acid dehydrogenase YdfG